MANGSTSAEFIIGCHPQLARKGEQQEDGTTMAVVDSAGVAWAAGGVAVATALGAVTGAVVAPRGRKGKGAAVGGLLGALGGSIAMYSGHKATNAVVFGPGSRVGQGRNPST